MLLWKYLYMLVYKIIKMDKVSDKDYVNSFE